MPVYSVWTRRTAMHSEDPSELAGIFSTRTLALEVGRRYITDEIDDHASIVEHHLNQEGPGYTIWDSWSESHGVIMEHYARFWPAGSYPASLTLGEAE